MNGGLLAVVDAQTISDAIGLGAVYALMAVGIGLVFGVLRLVNFAYGQLIMSGAYALAFASERDWPVWVGILLCFAVVVALSFRTAWSCGFGWACTRASRGCVMTNTGEATSITRRG